METEQTVQTQTPKATKLQKVAITILIIALGVVSYLYVTKNKQLELLQNPDAQAAYAQELNKDAVAELKKYVVVAEGEEPVLLGVVANAEALKSQQAFFANIQNGDQIFVFQQSSRALVWRPESKMVVNFGVLDVQAQQGEAPQTKQVEKEPAPKK